MTREPLVMIPPMLCDARVFAPLTAAMSVDHATCIMPTTGGDRIEDIASRILDWAPARFALLGAGMGGAVALEVIRRAPTRVLRIALMNCTSQPETPQTSAAREPLIVAARAGRFKDVVAQEMPAACFAEGPHRRMAMECVTDMAWAMGPEHYVTQARAMQRRRDQSATLRQIRQPAMVICGAEDTIYPVRRHEFMAEMIPYSRLEVIEGAGHLPMLEQPEATLAVMRDWMRQPLVLR
ncbi:alpha/beta fold hydrolase [Loktanella salsilacus]|jgi:pimeloyl-ACP methyl ester carboxylesterase|uniref:Pimeloyl-ACP methyl ester carboxylesterase n=1 Tax=Loktanella salsilacus TaxID=195913 RepID=A0A1I4ERG9_9RHOB|nr:alpha/beta fold hydrolase [Loktanella salsilacus]UTH45218.1 alpha/beta fold hydrolase [Loktanella salsilacus]SFL08308.1 Pimeloyl-ACP methyl ester carboxylesterase [Loktanella salsilacus]